MDAGCRSCAPPLCSVEVYQTIKHRALLAVRIDSETAVAQHANKDNQTAACGRRFAGPAKADMSPSWRRDFLAALTGEVDAEEPARLLQRLARGAAVGTGIE